MENVWAQKLPKFEKGDMKSHLLEESSFVVMFPKYREAYIKESFSLLKSKMQEYGIKTELDIINGTLKVATTKKTWDPCAILRARAIIQLISRCVPIEQAVRVLNDDTTHVIININGLVRSKSSFVNRRQRLIGANGTTLKALELLTDCYIVIQGQTVAAIGPYKGVYEVERVVKSTMDNVHPVYLLKRLMIMRQLASDPNMKNEDWSRFLPVFKAKTVTNKKPKKVKKKGPYTPFPPEQTERKQDQEIAEGKFFLDIDGKKKKRKAQQQKEGNESTHQERSAEEKGKPKKMKKWHEKMAKAFEAPEEPEYKPLTGKRNADVDVAALKRKLGDKKKKFKASV